jgi:hypothetical protein
MGVARCRSVGPSYTLALHAPRMSRPHIRIVLASRLARLFAFATVALIAFTSSSSSGRPPAVARFDALPRANERLVQPIWLSHCGMRIVEWRPTGALGTETSPSAQALAVLEDTCREAFDRYGDFLRAKGLPQLHTKPDVLPAISLLPANTLLDGKSARALNDLPTRFEAVAPGCCYWGLYVDSLNHLFLRNDPLVEDESGKLVGNPRFIRTLTHEIGHVLSARLGVWDVVGYDRQRDEDLAEEFVAFMGMHFPAESSAEDLAYHRSRANRAAPTMAHESSTATASVGHEKAQTPPPSASANTSPQR